MKNHCQVAVVSAALCLSLLPRLIPKTILAAAVACLACTSADASDSTSGSDEEKRYFDILQERGDLDWEAFWGSYYIPREHKGYVMANAARIMQVEGFPPESYLKDKDSLDSSKIATWIRGNPKAYHLIANEMWRPIEKKDEIAAMALMKARKIEPLVMPLHLYAPLNIYMELIGQTIQSSLEKTKKILETE